MLKQRVITAIVMLLVLLPAMFYASPVPFAAVAFVLICAAAWEWARLNQASGWLSYVSALACGLLCMVFWWQGALHSPYPSSTIWIAVGAAWVFAATWLLKGGVPSWSKINPTLRLAGGILMLAVAWLAVVQARRVGINFLLSILVLVWVADIFAYFAGRAFGGQLIRQKLAPSISPGKSWEGVCGGMAGVILLSFVWCWADIQFQATAQSLYSHLFAKAWWVMLIAVMFLAAMSVAGDLVESLVKRSAGAKDSSGLLPGHGGVLDRLDALLPTVPMAMMLYWI
jgi:phosphatidate cytidylyltransferase